jgi:hypothetical protein
MQMTNAQLAEFLNARLGLAGPDAVTVNVVRQWVAWDVLPKATAQGRAIGDGPTWSRSGAAVYRAMRLGELRKRGVRRENALIVQAYIEWGHRDFGRARDALSSEWRKWTAQLTRGQTTFLGKSRFPEISATQKRAIATQMGPLDDLFRGTQFEQSREFYAAIGEFSRTGEGQSDYLAGLMASAFQRFLPSLAQSLSSNVISMFVNSFSGMTGNADEIDNSADAAIRNASERQFRIARCQIRLFLSELRKSDQHRQSAASDFDTRQLWQMLDLLAPQISTGPWLVFSFVQALKSTALQVENTTKNL